MAYGHSRRGMSRRNGSFRRHRSKKVVPVPKAPKSTKTNTRYNAKAINKLAKQVSWLTEARYGSIQRNFQLSNLMIPFSGQPIITDIMDFSCVRSTDDQGARFGQYSTTTPPILQNVGQWVPSVNNFHLDQNLDRVDTGKYLALSCKVTIRCQAVPSAIDTRLRFDLVSVKKVPQTVTGSTIYALPQALNQLTDLCNPELNCLGNNPYLKVWKTKWVYLSSSRNMPGGGSGAQAPGPAVTGNSQYVTFNIKPKGGRLRTQQFTKPTAGSLTPAIVIPDGSQGPYNIGDQTAPFFLLMSSSDPIAIGPVPNLVNVQLSRVVVWRDPVGKTDL